jgi:S-adenosylmethionine:tRNA ribosyltransferase-isomerase
MTADREYTLSDFDFALPEDLVAQYPAKKREESRLFILDRLLKKFSHSRFFNLPDYLRDDDILVFNNSKVLPARLFFKRESGGLAEFVLVRRLADDRWLAITNRSARLKIGEKLFSVVDEKISIELVERRDEYFGIRTSEEFTDELLGKIGNVPLPPYIRREPNADDRVRYQTVYASQPGGVAAPTAGLHFTDDLLDKIRSRGITTLFVTLDVSWGTFQPVRAEKISEHPMHIESYEINENTADIMNAGRRMKRRIIAVGTTSLRVLESSFQEGANRAGRGETGIFIYPPRKVLSANALITNFHTPKSTLLMLVAAFAGYDLIMDAYREAVKEQYRFFSYGDSMLIF